ncbi:MAG: DUF1428 domain-containing protein [Verrucomicrobiae bacterium]|nr:DUF1428 domain-containing protein [Verrucomicrobiae bacterium]
MSKYIDGFVLPLPDDKVEVYRETASKAAAIWKEHGALEYVEAIGDDMEAQDMVPFPRMAGAGPNEKVVMAYIVYRSREHRDEVNAKIMADPRIKAMCDPEHPIFDYKRMAFGGFKCFVEA